MTLPREGKGSVSEHGRGDDGSDLVYPVFSRRSGGLSIGVNLYPDRKTCNFACPYCEVFPFSGPRRFETPTLKRELDRYFAARADIRAARAEMDAETGANDRAWFPVRDICVSGNGEPTLSPHFGEALAVCAEARRTWLGGPDGGTDLVLITNSTGFSQPGIIALLARMVRDERLVIWAKLDGADPDWFAIMSGSQIDFASTVASIESFARREPIVIQTMLCRVGDFEPDPERMKRYADLLAGMLSRGAHIREVHLYTKARPDPGDRCAPLGDARMLELAGVVSAGVGVPVRVFGESGEIPE
ncbi:MAG: hypothetical protein WAX33_07595 [Rectinemataceae bacterium]